MLPFHFTDEYAGAQSQFPNIGRRQKKTRLLPRPVLVFLPKFSVLKHLVIQFLWSLHKKTSEWLYSFSQAATSHSREMNSHGKTSHPTKRQMYRPVNEFPKSSAVPLLTSVRACSVTRLCLTLTLHRVELTRLLCLWDFPGKHPGVGCHFLLQRIFLT